MSIFRGISGRLLILTIIVVMLVEVAIFVPSVARFRLEYLNERVARAQIAALTVMAAPDVEMITPELEAQLLENSEAFNIVVHEADRRVLVLSRPVEGNKTTTYDLREGGALTLIHDALAHLIWPEPNEVIRVIAAPSHHGFDEIEVTLPGLPLRKAMLAYGLRILQLSLIISLITAAMIFCVVRSFVVSPLLEVIRNVKRFQENPEDPDRIIRPGSAIGEVAEAEQALAEMQQDVLTALRQRARLASLGEALSKISHDLRNMLAAGQLVVDRLEMSEDPIVVRVLPKLIGSLDRAIALCQRTLDYGRAEEPPPEFREVRLVDLAREAGEGLGLGHNGGAVIFQIDIDPSLTVRADPDQLYRVFANLLRNASEAIQASGRRGEIAVRATAGTDEVQIEISDTGPGMPARALEHLFEPFRGGARQGGTGLGLAIAAELVRAHGGSLSLVSSTTAGTCFRLTLPTAPSSSLPDR